MSTSQACTWPGDDPLMIAYHDAEWGKAVHDDHRHFEMLCLEGAQAGLSWRTVLHKRAGYRQLFHQFDPSRCAGLTDPELEKILSNSAIIRNRLKVYSVRKNAHAFERIQAEFGSFDHYIWSYLPAGPIINYPQHSADLPATSPLSDEISKDLKKRGFTFVGSTIVYAYLQAAGLVNDHLAGCPHKFP